MANEAAKPRTSAKICGMGHSMKRKEDPRFLQGKGNFIDDHTLPGMLWLDIVRSPIAYGKIVNIDSSKALEIDGVLAVLTGKDLEAYGLALDADADVGHPDGAADRYGHVPGPGGRGGDRDVALCGGGRGCGRRGRVRDR